MAWPFKKDETNSGGKPDEQNKAEIDSLVERLGASFEAKLEDKFKPIREEVTALKTRWETIENAAKPDPNANPDGTEFTDEQKATRAREATIAIAVTANARLTESEVINEVSAKWGKFVPKIKEFFANTPLNRKAQTDYPEYCRNIVKMVIGDAALSSGLSYGQDNKFFLEDAATRSGGEDSPLNDSSLAWTDPRSGKTLSASQQLAKLGIDPKEFAESMKNGVV